MSQFEFLVTLICHTYATHTHSTDREDMLLRLMSVRPYPRLYSIHSRFKIQDSKVLLSYAQSYTVEMAMELF